MCWPRISKENVLRAKKINASIFFFSLFALLSFDTEHCSNMKICRETEFGIGAKCGAFQFVQYTYMSDRFTHLTNVRGAYEIQFSSVRATKPKRNWHYFIFFSIGTLCVRR